jgi:predicted nucleic acid-binding Zn ribbon protein
MTQSSPETLGAVIDGLMHQLGLQRKLKQYDIVPLWPSIVGEQIAGLTSVDKIDKDVLIVKVSAAPWRTELTFRKKEILDKVHAAMNSDSIKDIRFR